jgi:DNA-binding GntR family transcriptional regulator
MIEGAGLPSQDKKLTSLSEQVYEFLRVAIIRAELKPGEKLVEMDIAAQMGTSQGPVREALQRLERDGLVERQARSATFVSDVAVDEVYELFAIRSSIEAFAIRRTAKHITDAQCRQLDTLLHHMVKAGSERSLFTLTEYDMQFHRYVVEWSQNAGLLRAWLPLSNQLQRFIVHSHLEHFPDFVEIATRHQPIIDKLREHNADGAAEVIQEHIMLIWGKIIPDS